MIEMSVENICTLTILVVAIFFVVILFKYGFEKIDNIPHTTIVMASIGICAIVVGTFTHGIRVEEEKTDVTALDGGRYEVITIDSIPYLKGRFGTIPPL